MSTHTVFSRCQALGYRFGHFKMNKAGMQIAALYRETYGKSPERAETEILGKVFNACVYPEEFTPRMDELLGQLYRDVLQGKYRGTGKSAPAKDSCQMLQGKGHTPVTPHSRAQPSGEEARPGAAAASSCTEVPPAGQPPVKQPAAAAPEQGEEKPAKRVRQRITRPVPLTGTNLLGRKSVSK